MKIISAKQARRKSEFKYFAENAQLLETIMTKIHLACNQKQQILGGNGTLPPKIVEYLQKLGYEYSAGFMGGKQFYTISW